MRFQPLSETEVLNLLPAGEYEFLVKKAEDQVSKNTGNEMIKLTLSIWDNMNVERTVFDYLLPSMMYKVKHFADAVGLTAEYEAGGYTAAQCEHKSGKCKIVIDDKPDSNFPPKNVVKDYIKADPNAPVKMAAPKQDDVPFEDSDLPF